MENECTALHEAVLRGDMEVVEILLSAGADPMATNNLGMDAVGMSWNYPALRGLLQKRRRALRFNKSTILQSTLELEEESVVHLITIHIRSLISQSSKPFFDRYSASASPQPQIFIMTCGSCR